MRAEWFTESTRPFSRALRIMRSQSAVLSAMGFSTKTWHPISSASNASGAWVPGRREDVDDLGLGFGHRPERGVDLRNLELGGQSGGALLVEVGNSHDFDKWQAA